MIIQCTSCRTRYHYDEGRFAGVAVKKIRCTKCTTIFEIFNPKLPFPAGDFQVDETGPLTSPPLGSDDFSLDPTVMGTAARKRTLPPPVANATARTPRPPDLPLPPPLPRDAADPTSSTGEFARAGVVLDRPLKLPDTYRLSLACIAGPDSGRIFEVEKAKVTIGRANADILLTDSQCSRQHAAIEVSEDQAWLLDLGSTNGTWMGEKRIERQPLDNRTEFDIGTTTLMFIKTRRD